MVTNGHKAAAEFFGTALLTVAVIGSGIMATRLSHDAGVQLIINMISIAPALGLLILVFGPISGSHFNPVISVNELIKRRISIGRASLYIALQIAGAVLGALFANFSFGLHIFQISNHNRITTGVFVSEMLATLGLVLTIGALEKMGRPNLTFIAVPVWIFSAVFFTSSTSFANPAVTIGRMLSNTFTGISPTSTGPFILAQFAGGLLGLAILKLIPTQTVKNQTKGASDAKH